MNERRERREEEGRRETRKRPPPLEGEDEDEATGYTSGSGFVVVFGDGDGPASLRDGQCAMKECWMGYVGSCCIGTRL